MPLNSTDFNQILNIAPSGHVETIQNIIKDTSPSQEHQNHHQLQPKIYKCHQSLRGFLMPSNLSDFNEILNIAPSGHVETRHVHEAGRDPCVHGSRGHFWGLAWTQVLKKLVSLDLC